MGLQCEERRSPISLPREQKLFQMGAAFVILKVILSTIMIIRLSIYIYIENTNEDETRF